MYLTIGRGESFTHEFGLEGGEFHPRRGESFTQDNLWNLPGYQQVAVGETLPPDSPAGWS